MSYFVNVEIEINHHCNMACTYCPNSVTERAQKGLISTEQFCLILSKLKAIQYRGKMSYHFYNEPLLHPDLLQFVELTKQELPEVTIEIYTNGVYLTKDYFFKLVEKGVNRFTVTKHQGIKSLPLEGFMPELDKDLAKKINYKNYQKLIMTNRGGVVEAGKELTEELKQRPCLIPQSTLVITVDGTVLPCYEDFHQKNSMGNIFQSSFEEIWNSEKYISFREDLKNGKRCSHNVCETCNNRMMF